MRETYYEIKYADVGRAFIKAFGRVWSVTDFMGCILPGDVGKRVFRRGDILQVENDQQRRDRLRGTFKTGEIERVEPLEDEELIEQTVDRIERFAVISNYTEVGNAIREALKVGRERIIGRAKAVVLIQDELRLKDENDFVKGQAWIDLVGNLRAEILEGEQKA